MVDRWIRLLHDDRQQLSFMGMHAQGTVAVIAAMVVLVVMLVAAKPSEIAVDLMKSARWLVSMGK